MPDGRFLSKSISLSEQLAGVSFEAAFLFTWCIPHLDSEGRMLGNPAAVKATAVPNRKEIPIEMIPDLLMELASAPKDDRNRPLIYWYEVQNRALLEFPGFSGHQRGLRKEREAKSRLPSRKHPQARDLTAGGNTPPDERRSDSGGGPEEVPLSEEKEYVSTPDISVRSRGSNPPAGAAPKGALPADLQELSPQELHERKERFKAGIHERQEAEAKK